MNNEIKKQNNKLNINKNKKNNNNKSRVQNKKSNSNLDWYYKNNFKKKNSNNKNNKKNKNKYQDNKNKKVLNINTNTVKNIELGNKIINDKKGDLINYEVKPKKKLLGKIFLFKNKKNKELNINNNDLDNDILVKKTEIKEQTITTENVALDKTIIIKKQKKKKEVKISSDTQVLPKKKEEINKIGINKIESNNNTLYGRKKLNLDNDKIAKKSRKWIYFKEALMISLIFSLVNIVAYLLIDNVMIINITNLEFVNIIITFIVSFIIMFIITFIVDYILTEFIVKHKVKKQQKEGDSNRSRWFIKRESMENIEPKKRK